MSPSEDQLRAALRDGEGPAPDPMRVIGHALRVRRQRRERRNRVLGAVAAVVVVGGLGFGLAHTQGNSGNSGSSAGANRSEGTALGASSNAAAGNANGGASDAPSRSPGFATPKVGAPDYTAGSSCPSTPVRYALPGGGGIGQFGANGPIFVKPVASLRFCLYSADGATYTGSRTLAGNAAKQFAATVEAALDTGHHEQCVTATDVGAILPFDAAGAPLTPLSVSAACNEVQITDGTAVRYLPISSLNSASAQTSGAMSGSPPR